VSQSWVNGKVVLKDIPYYLVPNQKEIHQQATIEWQGKTIHPVKLPLAVEQPRDLTILVFQ
jgi:hypothetical protein